MMPVQKDFQCLNNQREASRIETRMPTAPAGARRTSQLKEPTVLDQFNALGRALAVASSS